MPRKTVRIKPTVTYRPSPELIQALEVYVNTHYRANLNKFINHVLKAFLAEKGLIEEDKTEDEMIIDNFKDILAQVGSEKMNSLLSLIDGGAKS